MGKATRWFKGLFGLKKDKENHVENKTEKKRWSFAKSGNAPAKVNELPASDKDWLRSYIAESEKEQNKHIIAVAAATAAAADAAVAAAQAAVAVVKLTRQGREAMASGDRERAAVKIQTVFRGYLARKALRALKRLVKLQAVVRGYLVRKRAAATLHSMQALIRAQATIRAQRARRSIKNDQRSRQETRARKSMERFDEPKSEFHSKRVSTCNDPFDENPKIVEIDTGRPKSRSQRMNSYISEYGDDQYFQNPNPYNLSIPQDFDWAYLAQDGKFATAQNTPRLGYSGRANGPMTPAKSVCGDILFRPYSNCPNYMTNTQSFRAKLRSYSAPKQRPEPGPKKRLSLDEIMASRSSFSGVRMQRSCSQVQEDVEC